MSNKIKVYRGLEATIPTLDEGELGYTTDSKKVFIGTDSGNKEIGANGVGGGDGIDLNTLGYMNYAADIFYRGGHQSLFANTWNNHNKRTTLFDENISFVVSDSSMGFPLSFYSGAGIDELYDLLASGGARPMEALKITFGVGMDNFVFDATSIDSVTNTGVSLRYVGDQSGGFGLPTPVYAAADEENNPFLIVVNATELGIPIGKVVAFIGNENINYLKIESGSNHYYENGIIIPDGVEIVPVFSYGGSIGHPVIDGYIENNDFPLVIPNSVKIIAYSAFQNWTSNNQPLVIPNSVTSIGDDSFSYWEANNQPLVIPNSVTSIGQFAFQNWTSNNQPLVIPNSVTSIGYQSFYNWTSAKEFIMESETPPTITFSSFSNTNNAPIFVPDGSVNDYKTATNWVDLADRIYPISDRDNIYTKEEVDLMIGDIESALDAILGV